MNIKFKKVLSTVVTAGLMAAMVLSFGACQSKKKLIIYNWGDYIAEDTISKFKAKFPQYEVVYRTFETNETMYPNLSNGYDVIIPSDYMVRPWITRHFQRFRKTDIGIYCFQRFFSVIHLIIFTDSVSVFIIRIVICIPK